LRIDRAICLRIAPVCQDRPESANVVVAAATLTVRRGEEPGRCARPRRLAPASTPFQRGKGARRRDRRSRSPLRPDRIDTRTAGAEEPPHLHHGLGQRNARRARIHGLTISKVHAACMRPEIPTTSVQLILYARCALAWSMIFISMVDKGPVLRGMRSESVTSGKGKAVTRSNRRPANMASLVTCESRSLGINYANVRRCALYLARLRLR
jgi:hypothetical protein